MKVKNNISINVNEEVASALLCVDEPAHLEVLVDVVTLSSL
jgi:hypothetical protein